MIPYLEGVRREPLGGRYEVARRVVHNHRGELPLGLALVEHRGDGLGVTNVTRDRQHGVLGLEEI